MTSKTNWISTDKFNYTDFNRISTNFDDMLNVAKYFINIVGVTNPKFTGYNQHPTAESFNALEVNAENVYTKSSIKLYPTYSKKTWYPNQHSPDFSDINRLEQLCADYYNLYSSSYSGIKRLSFRLNGGRF